MDPLRRFQALYRRVEKLPLNSPSAMTLSTADRRGRVSSRTVLLKGCDAHGFFFCTNENSLKGRELRSNPWASLCFHWDSFTEQVTVEGKARRVPPAESDAYWLTRPRDSQLGAWASLQSQRLPSRKVLLARARSFAAKFAGGPVPRPPHWTGYRLVPERIEFWKAGAHRLNHRRLFVRKAGRWTSSLLYP